MPHGRPPAEPEAEWIVLVDDNDRGLGTAEKPRRTTTADDSIAPSPSSSSTIGAACRFSSERRRSTNFRCSGRRPVGGNPRPGEEVSEAAGRRVREELGVHVELSRVFALVYATEDPATGLTEREYDHVLVGRLPVDSCSDPGKVEAWHGGSRPRDRPTDEPPTGS